MTKRLSLFTLSLLLVSSIAAASSFSSLEERMSDAEFRASGLDRLSADELERLNDWLRQNLPSAAPSGAQPYAGGEDTRGLRVPATGSDGGTSIISRIDGEFTGWRTGSRFRLENGMVWEVIGSVPAFNTNRLSSPTVSIEPGFMGSWRLRVEGYNTTVNVRRVE